MERSAALSVQTGSVASVHAGSVDSRPLSAESLNQLTHGAGFVFSVVGVAVMMATVRASGDVLQIVGCGFYCASLLALYAASTLSHSFNDSKRRNFYRKLDQLCIFVLAIGNFTPFAVVHLRGGLWWVLPVVMWTMAVIGINARLRKGNENVSVFYYVMMSCLPMFALGQVWRVSGTEGLSLVLVGGLSYMIGLFFLTNDERAPYYHVVWHVLVIIGSICHYLFLLHYAAMWPL